MLKDSENADRRLAALYSFMQKSETVEMDLNFVLKVQKGHSFTDLDFFCAERCRHFSIVA